MRNLLVELRYKGTAYHGFQVQKNGVSVMERVQDAIEQVLRVREPIAGCSRTDSGVHANQFFFHMKTGNPVPADKFLFAVNNALPPDIAALSCREVPLDFHARYSCVGKEYVYQIYDGPVKEPFWADSAWYHRLPLDAPRMEREAQALLGTHAFTSFCALGGKAMSHVRTIDALTVRREGRMVRMTVHADGFLYNMVRIIAGTLVDLNDGLLPAGALPDVLAAEKRERAGRTAPPHGLFLNRVDYD